MEIETAKDPLPDNGSRAEGPEEDHVHTSPPAPGSRKGTGAGKGSSRKGKINPAKIAKDMMARRRFIASPIDRSGTGAVLYCYTDGAYRKDGASILRSDVFSRLGKDYRDRHAKEIDAIVREAAKTDVTSLNTHADRFLNVENGMLDLGTLALVEHDPTYMSTMQLRARWDANARSKELEAYIESSVPEDARNIYWELMGYALTMDRKHQVGTIWTGEGSNGKGVGLKILDAVLGPELVTHVALQRIADDRFAAAELDGRLVVMQGDIPATTIKDTSTIKSIISQDRITVERKYGHPYDIVPFAFPIFSCNEIPRALDRTYGWIRRWIILPWPYQFGGEGGKPIIKDLDIKLTSAAALSAWLVQAVHGLRRLRAQGRFSGSASAEKAKVDYEAQNDSAVAWIRRGWDRAPANHVHGKQALFDEYAQDCGRDHVGAATQREFNATVVRVLRCGESARDGADGKRYRVWTGIVRRADSV